MRVYICGPSEPCPMARAERFEHAARHLVGLGHSPASVYTSGFLGAGSLRERTALDAAALGSAEVIVTLPGTDGDQYEIVMAAMLGKPVISFEQIGAARSAA